MPARLFSCKAFMVSILQITRPTYHSASRCCTCCPAPHMQQHFRNGSAGRRTKAKRLAWMTLNRQTRSPRESSHGNYSPTMVVVFRQEYAGICASRPRTPNQVRACLNFLRHNEPPTVAVPDASSAKCDRPSADQPLTVFRSCARPRQSLVPPHWH
jgi:hypothetical protein